MAAAVAPHGLGTRQADQIWELLVALEREPDPHTTVSDPARALDVHVLDSLVAAQIEAVRSARSIVDIGAGPGFPGLPLAIALPEARVDLVETSSRKCAVIDRLAAAADIGNARAVHARVEDWARAGGAVAYDIATARAVAPLAVLTEYAAPLLRVGGTFVAWKGVVDAAERRDGDAAADALGLKALGYRRVEPFEGARGLSLYLYCKVRETPPRYPRKAGIAAKRPLGADNLPEQGLT